LNSLGWIKYDSGDYNEAIRLFETGFKKFDGSLSWLWGLADAHKKAGHYQTALGFYEKIIKKVGSDSSESGYNEVVARWKVIQCMENLTMDTEIIRQAKCIQNAIVESSMLDRAKEYREKSREAGKRAEKRLKRAMNNSAEK
jgi:tetratricopeptide (TPR) repeat protein